MSSAVAALATNAAGSRTIQSACIETTVASGSRRAASSVAQTRAGPVDAARGSIRKFSAGRSRCGREVPSARAAPETTRIRSAGMKPASRSTASSALDRGPASGSSCLGREGDDSGQKRVPEPPASRMAHCIASTPSQKRNQRRRMPAEIVQERAEVRHRALPARGGSRRMATVAPPARRGCSRPQPAPRGRPGRRRSARSTLRAALVARAASSSASSAAGRLASTTARRR